MNSSAPIPLISVHLDCTACGGSGYLARDPIFACHCEAGERVMHQGGEDDEHYGDDLILEVRS